MKMIQPRALACRISVVLIVGGVLAAQESKPFPDPATPGQAIQGAAKAAAHDAPQDRPKRAVSEVMYRARGNEGNVEVLTDTQGVNFGPYLKDLVATVRKNWYALIPADAKTKKGKLAIEFAIHKDGSITNLRLTAASGDHSLDRAAWGAVTGSVPFAPLPDAFSGPSLALRLRFSYNLDKSDGNAEGWKTAADPNPEPPLLKVQAGRAGSSQVGAERQPAAPVLCSSPKPTTTHVEGEIASKASAAGLQKYLDSNVLPLIRANWYRLISRSGEKVAGDASVEFEVLKDGTIDSVKLIDGAGHASLGDLAINAVKNSAPLPPVPSDFAGGSFGVRSHFFYQPDPNLLHGRVTAENGDTPAFARACTQDERSKGALDCMVAPKPTYSPEPQFSEEARQQKKEGVVAVWIVVAHDGTVQSACVNHPVGYGLDEQAVDAVRSWKFTPATFNHQPLATKLLVEVDFHLSNNPGGTAPEGTNSPVTSPPR